MWEIQDVTAVNMMFLPSARKKTLSQEDTHLSFASGLNSFLHVRKPELLIWFVPQKAFESMQLSLCLSGYSIICTSLEISHSFSGICGKKVLQVRGLIHWIAFSCQPWQNLTLFPWGTEVGFPDNCTQLKPLMHSECNKRRGSIIVGGSRVKFAWTPKVVKRLTKTNDTNMTT